MQYDRHCCSGGYHGLKRTGDEMHSAAMRASPTIRNIRAHGAVVNQQNTGDALYQPMAGHFNTSAAYKAACDLVFKGLEQPSGYTEPLLHAWRLKVKAGTA